MIATATVCLSRALSDENPKLLMAASALCLLIQPLMVSAIHTGLMEREKYGREPDALEVFLESHKPRGKKSLDETSSSIRAKIQTELNEIPETTTATDIQTRREKIYKELVGEDKNGYAKTYGLGVIVPRSSRKRTQLEEERKKRKKLMKKIKWLLHEARVNNAIPKKLVEKGLLTEDDLIASVEEVNLDEDDQNEDELEDQMTDGEDDQKEDDMDDDDII